MRCGVIRRSPATSSPSSATAARAAMATRRRPGSTPASLTSRRSTTTASCALPRSGRGDAQDQRLRPRRSGGAGVQARQRGRARPAASGTVSRDLGVLGARRGHPPALWPDRPRRPALVRPPRRLPHRGARAGQGAEGQEHRHRADGREGRLLPQASAAARREPRLMAGRGDGSVQGVRPRAAVADRQPRPRRHEHPAGGRRLPRCARPVPRRRRRQGDGDLLGHRECRSRSTPASGSATPLPAGGRVGYDHKAMAITAQGRVDLGGAPLPRDRRRRAGAIRSPSSASAT